MNNLIQIASETDLTLLTSTDTIIKKFKNQISTLNLIFAMTEIICRLASCTVNWVIENESDHYLIFIVLCLEIVTQSQQQRQQWKSMNMKKVTTEAQHFHILIFLIMIFMSLCLSCSVNCFVYFQCSSRAEIADCWFDKQHCIFYKLFYKLH